MWSATRNQLSSNPPGQAAVQDTADKRGAACDDLDMCLRSTGWLPAEYATMHVLQLGICWANQDALLSYLSCLWPTHTQAALSSARAELSSQTEALGRALKEGEAARREAADKSAQLEKLQAAVKDKQGASDNVRSHQEGVHSLHFRCQQRMQQGSLY